jgi:hypothetical protein
MSVLPVPGLATITGPLCLDHSKKSDQRLPLLLRRKGPQQFLKPERGDCVFCRRLRFHSPSVYRCFQCRHIWRVPIEPPKPE